MYNLTLIDFQSESQKPPAAKTNTEQPTYSEKAVQTIYLLREMSPEYTGKKAKEKIGAKLKLPAETVDEYLAISDLYTPSTLQCLDEAKLNKKQYHNILKVINRTSLKFRQDDMSDKKIQIWITKLVVEMLSDLKKFGSINVRGWLMEWASRIGYIEKDIKNTTKTLLFPKRKRFSYQPGVTSSLYGPKSAEQILKKLYEIVDDLSNLPDVKADNVDVLRDGINKALCDLGSVGISLNEIEKDDDMEGERWEV